MLHHADLDDSVVRRMIRSREILFAGNQKLKLFGTLHCASGRRMTRANRVFFSTVEAAKAEGYRPCGHCMKSDYAEWRAGSQSKPKV